MRVVKITETELAKLVAKVLSEDHEGRNNRYMFFQNWADDHVSEAKNNLDQVFDFMMNEIHGDDIRTMDVDIEVMEEGKKKTGSKLCARGKSAAKAKFDVYPSAYANGYAVQVCKGRMPGLDGKKRCSGLYC